MDKLYLGAAYYPELWAESEIDADIARCKEIGINVLRIGEFAWGKIEPAEGEFHTEWLKRVIEKLHAAEIDTVLCTPTATPPRWLYQKYPETLRVEQSGKRSRVASRCHTCKTSEIMRQKNALVTKKLAEAFANTEGVIGWQLDNEIFPYGGGCFCEQCKKAFREHLHEKFRLVDRLNAAWGMDRWSLSYNDFSEIEPPYDTDWNHPSLQKAWLDFQCEQICSYLDEQAEILHKHGIRIVGTDMMPNNTLSYYKVAKNLDVVQFNHYDRAIDLPYTTFSYDFLRCVKDKPFWVTETQAGWNGAVETWFGYRPQKNCYINTLLPFFKGAEMNMYWLFRAQRSGHEVAHGALYSSAGRVYRVTEEIKVASNDLEKCKEFLSAAKIKSRVALHYSSEAANMFSFAPILEKFNYRETLRKKYYAALRHYNVDVIDLPHDLTGYAVLISPFVATLDEETADKISAWVQDGGVWIVGPMSDIFDENMSRFTYSPYGILEKIAGVYTTDCNPVGNEITSATWINGKYAGEQLPLSDCYDSYVLCDGTEGIAKYEDREEFVITRRKLGKGKIILVGSVIGGEDLRKLLESEAGVLPLAEASDNVILTEYFAENGTKQVGFSAVETENKEGFIDLDGEYINLMNGRTAQGRVFLQPYEAAMFKKMKI